MNSPTTRYRGFSAAAVLLAAMILAWLAPQAGAQESDTVVKAGFIRNFALRAKWPDKAFPDSSAPFTIGIVGDDALAAVLERDCRDQLVARRKIIVKRTRQADELRKCQIVYFSNPDKGRVGEIASGTNILTVGDGEQFTREAGGAIGFLLQKGETARFEIKLSAARGVDLSSVIRLGKIVK